MSPEPAENLFLLVGNLTGKVESILQAMAIWQQGSAARDERVEALERRMSAMEGNLATKEDHQALSARLEALSAQLAESRGSSKTLGSISAQGAAWAAVIIAMLALIGVGRNRSEIIRQEQRQAPIERPAMEP